MTDHTVHMDNVHSLLKKKKEGAEGVSASSGEEGAADPGHDIPHDEDDADQIDAVRLQLTLLRQIPFKARGSIVL